MAEPIVLGIVGIKNMGIYDADTSYDKLNVVTYQGSSYCALKETKGNLPTNTEYWQLYAEKGDTGPQGPTGQQGPKPVKGVDYYTQGDKAEISYEIDTVVADEVSSQIGNLTSATPLVANSISDMIDTTRIYVNTSDGKWYYYDGDSWEIGGTYQSTGISNGSITAEMLDKDLQSLFVKNMIILDLPEPVVGKTLNVSNGKLVLANSTYFGYYKLDISDYVGSYVYYLGQSYNSNKACVIVDDEDNVLFATDDTSGSKKYNLSGYVKIPVGAKYLYLDVNGGNATYAAYQYAFCGVINDLRNVIDFNKYTTLIPDKNADNSYIPETNYADTLNQIIVQKLTPSINHVHYYKMIKGYKYLITGEVPVFSGYHYMSYVLTSDNLEVVEVSTATYEEGDTINYEFIAKYDGYIVCTSSDSVPITVKRLDTLEIINNPQGIDFSDLKIGFTGDSICAGSGYSGGYARILHDNYGLNYQNTAVSGGHLAHDRDDVFVISEHITDFDSDCDAYIIEGGINDRSNSVPMGTITTGYTTAVDNTTFIGALEKIFRDLYSNYPGKKFAYLIVHNVGVVYDLVNSVGKTWADYREAIYEVCKKYGVHVIDVGANSSMNTYDSTMASTYTGFNADKLHPNKDGYEKFYVPEIKKWIQNILK